MSKKPPAFQLYAQDFLTGVMYLTNEEIGIYIKMLCKQWTDDKIPKKRLGFLTGKDWELFSDELKNKFVDMGDYLINTRLEEERLKHENFKKKQSENGKKGGRPLKYKKPNKSQKKPLEEEIENEIENENVIELYPTFEDFWDLYDKKVGKKEKIKEKWGKLKHQTKEQIMAYVPMYKQSQPDKQFRKNPETFLNNESWNDELIKPNNGKQIANNQGASDEFRRKTAERLGIVRA
jgi:uncharacterized protein YdaU (DUF1376 family)